MSSINGEDHVPDKADIPSDKEPVASRDSEIGDGVTKEPSGDLTCTADKPCIEEEASESNIPSQNEESLPLQNDESLPEVIKSSQEVDKSIKSPPIDTSYTSEAEKIPDQVDIKDSSPVPDDDEWLDILGSGHLKKKVHSSAFNLITLLNC